MKGFTKMSFRFKPTALLFLLLTNVSSTANGKITKDFDSTSISNTAVGDVDRTSTTFDSSENPVTKPTETSFSSSWKLMTSSFQTSTSNLKQMIFENRMMHFYAHVILVSYMMLHLGLNGWEERKRKTIVKSSVVVRNSFYIYPASIIRIIFTSIAMSSNSILYSILRYNHSDRPFGFTWTMLVICLPFSVLLHRGNVFQSAEIGLIVLATTALYPRIFLGLPVDYVSLICFCCGGISFFSGLLARSTKLSARNWIYDRYFYVLAGLLANSLVLLIAMCNVLNLTASTSSEFVLPENICEYAENWSSFVLVVLFLVFGMLLILYPLSLIAIYSATYVKEMSPFLMLQNGSFLIICMEAISTATSHCAGSPLTQFKIAVLLINGVALVFAFTSFMYLNGVACTLPALRHNLILSQYSCWVVLAQKASKSSFNGRDRRVSYDKAIMSAEETALVNNKIDETCITREKHSDEELVKVELSAY